MNILLVMIPLSILLLVGAGIAFFWAVDHGQFEDMETPRLVPLLDNPEAPPDMLPAGAAKQTGPTPTTPEDEHANADAGSERD